MKETESTASPTEDRKPTPVSEGVTVERSFTRIRTVSMAVIALLALGVMLKVMSGVLIQVAIALFAMFLVNPAVNRATAIIDGLIRKLPVSPAKKPGKARKETAVAEVIGSVTVILLALLLVGFAGLVAYGTGNMLAERKTDLLVNVVQPVGEFIEGVQQQWLPWLYRSLGIDEVPEAFPSDSLQVMIPMGKRADPLRTTLDTAFGGVSFSSLVPTAANLVGTVTNFLFKLAIITLLTIFMVSGRRVFSREMLKNGKTHEHRRIREIVAAVEAVPRRYLTAKMITSLLTGVLIGSGLLMWLEPGDAYIWGFVAAVLNFIPFFGSLIAGILIVLYTLSIAGLSGAWSLLMVVLVNNLVSNVIEPNFFDMYLPIGKVTVIVCVLTWGFLWGLPGVFLAVPITIMIKEFLEQIFGKNPFTIALEV